MKLLIDAAPLVALADLDEPRRDQLLETLGEEPGALVSHSPSCRQTTESSQGAVPDGLPRVANADARFAMRRQAKRPRHEASGRAAERQLAAGRAGLEFRFVAARALVGVRHRVG